MAEAFEVTSINCNVRVATVSEAGTTLVCLWPIDAVGVGDLTPEQALKLAAALKVKAEQALYAAGKTHVGVTREMKKFDAFEARARQNEGGRL